VVPIKYLDFGVIVMLCTFEKEYRELVVPYAPPVGSNRRIIIPEAKLEKIKGLAKQIAEAKQGEKHHLIDGKKEYKRQLTGLLGEAAIEEFFGIEVIDFSVGNSNTYNVADMKKAGFNLGVKTVEMWKFPIVHKKPRHPELICVKRQENEVVFFGYASKSVLRKFQTDDFVLDKRLRARGTKSAFYGFSELQEVDTLDDLIYIYNKLDQRKR